MEMKTLACFFDLLLLTVLVKGSAVPRGRGGRVVMCYFEGVSAVRPQEEARFTPEDLDVTICTHVVYNRAMVTRELGVVPKDEDVALGKDGVTRGMYNRTRALKEVNPALKIYIDIYDYDGHLERQMAEEQESANHNDAANAADASDADSTVAAAAFARAAADFVELHGFDGMDIRMRNSEVLHKAAPAIRKEFLRRRLDLLTFVLPPDAPDGKKFEMTEMLSRNFDLILIGSYWKVAMITTEAFSSLALLESMVNGYDALGIPPEKLVVAIPAFVVSLKLCSRDACAEGCGVGVPICDGGDEGAYEETKIILHHSELIRKMANTSEDWIVARDPESKLPYGHSKSLQWASFEDADSVRAKAQFVLQRDMAGAAIMNVDFEDFKGAFTQRGETFPLTRAAFDELNGDPVGRG